MIQPTVGKRLWYWPALAAKPEMPYDFYHQPLAATVTLVNPDGTVNISYWNRNGDPETKACVYLWQQGAIRPSGSFCEYHPDDVAAAQIAMVTPILKAEEVILSSDFHSRPVLSLKKAESL